LAQSAFAGWVSNLAQQPPTRGNGPIDAQEDRRELRVGVGGKGFCAGDFLKGDGWRSGIAAVCGRQKANKVRRQRASSATAPVQGNRMPLDLHGACEVLCGARSLDSRHQNNVALRESASSSR